MAAATPLPAEISHSSFSLWLKCLICEFGNAKCKVSALGRLVDGSDGGLVVLDVGAGLSLAYAPGSTPQQPEPLYGKHPEPKTRDISSLISSKLRRKVHRYD